MTAKQDLPDTTRDYSTLPTENCPAETAMYRAHSPRGAWWFDNGIGGRFNLHGARGTCYAATTLDTAVREWLRDDLAANQTVSPHIADTFVVSTVTTPNDYVCAAVSHSDAARWGIVRALTTMELYDVPQAWAAVIDAAGFDGVFYGSAYTTGGPTAYALFNEAGAPPAGHAEARIYDGTAACTAVGINVVPPRAFGMPTI